MKERIGRVGKMRRLGTTGMASLALIVPATGILEGCSTKPANGGRPIETVSQSPPIFDCGTIPKDRRTLLTTQTGTNIEVQLIECLSRENPPTSNQLVVFFEKDPGGEPSMLDKLPVPLDHAEHTIAGLLRGNPPSEECILIDLKVKDFEILKADTMPCPTQTQPSI